MVLLHLTRSNSLLREKKHTCMTLKFTEKCMTTNRLFEEASQFVSLGNDSRCVSQY